MPEAKAFSIDPWSEYPGKPARYGEGDATFELWLKKLKRHIGRRAWPIRGFSWDVAACFPFSIDFLLIDGDHSELAVLKDLKLWVPKVNPGGIVVGDNLEMPSVRRAVDRYGHPYQEGYIFGFNKRRPQFWFYKEQGWGE